METSKQGTPETNKQTEKERLELVEKKVDIRKKKIEIEKEKLNIDQIVIRRDIALEEQKALIEKISELRRLLGDVTVDDERTIMASEPFLTPVLNGYRKELVLNKLMELIKKL